VNGDSFMVGPEYAGYGLFYMVFCNLTLFDHRLDIVEFQTKYRLYL